MDQKIKLSVLAFIIILLAAILSYLYWPIKITILSLQNNEPIADTELELKSYRGTLTDNPDIILFDGKTSSEGTISIRNLYFRETKKYDEWYINSDKYCIDSHVAQKDLKTKKILYLSSETCKKLR